MNSFNKYTLITGRLLVLIVLLTTAGAASIHHECIAHAQSCCSKAEAPVQKGCDNGVPPAGQVLTINGSCHTNTVLGAVARTPALVAKDVKSNGLKYLLPAFLASVFSPQELTAISCRPSSQSSETPRTTQRKYILNSSLLI